MRGEIKTVNESGGFGFIKPENGKDLYFRLSDVNGEAEVGAGVEFETKQTEKGFNAIKIKITGQEGVKELVVFEKDGKKPHKDLFDKNAQDLASILGKDSNKNKSSQIRKFYDMVVKYYDSVRFKITPEEKKDEIQKVLPYIAKLKADVQNSFSKGTVDKNFKLFIDECVEKVKSSESFEDLKIFKTLFESILGFYKN